MYKIRNTKTGLWSMGGVYEDFNTIGKVWKDLKGVKATLRIWTENKGGGYKHTIPDEWEIVEIAMIEKDKQSAKEFYNKLLTK